MHMETHNIVIQNITCKLAHKAKLTTEIGREHRKVNFTIVLNRTNWCSLFLTVQSDFYK